MNCSECNLSKADSIKIMDNDNNIEIIVCQNCLKKYKDYFVSRRLSIDIKCLCKLLNKDKIKEKGGDSHNQKCSRYPNCRTRCFQCLDVYTEFLQYQRCQICGYRRLIITYLNNDKDIEYYICPICILIRKHELEDANVSISIREFYKFLYNDFIKLED